MCFSEDALDHKLGAPYIDDVMSYNSLATTVIQTMTQIMYYYWASELANKLSLLFRSFPYSDFCNSNPR